MTVSNRATEIKPFYVMEAVRAAQELEAAGQDILHLEVGQPSTAAPEPVREAAHHAIDNNVIGYTMPQGVPELRQRIVEWYRERYEIEVDQERIIITPGASGSCAIAFLALFDHGDRVGVIEPGYPCYRNDLAVLGIDVVSIPVGPDTGYRPTPDVLDQFGQLDGLVLASPSNPTGTVLDAAQLGALTDWARSNDTTLVVDEIYHGITYDEPAVTALAIDPDVTVFNSFSKFWSMTGWRLGWIVAPTTAVAAFERVMANLLISAPTISQIAGIAAFDAVPECEENVARYRINRQLLIDGLRAAGIDRIAPPDGAFYIWADVSHLVAPNTEIENAQELCRRWLTELGVAATPGIDFDPARGDHFVRFSYATSATTITAATERLAAWAP